MAPPSGGAIMRITMSIEMISINLQVKTKKQWREMSEQQKAQHNYFVYGTNDTYTFILNHYKTSGKYGQKTMEVTLLNDTLKRWKHCP